MTREYPKTNQYPTLTDDEAKAIVKAKPHPKVTEDLIKSKIEHVAYTVVEGTGTLCIITMRNGWMSTGFSAPADPRNFDQEVGKRYAYDHAFRPLWQLEGYLLRDKLFHEEPLIGEVHQVDERPFQDVAIVPSNPGDVR